MRINEVLEGWSDKYKRSINCSNPKGFSQRAHCQGRKKTEDVALHELNIPQTLDFIKQAHSDQLYGKLPYWTHPRAVAMTGKKIFGNKFNSDAVKVAFLHDVVEDTHIGLDELSKMEFSPQVIEAVGLLTKNKSLTYRQNIENIINSGNPLAMMVKYADNYENFSGDKSSWDPARAASSQKKYLTSLNMLGAKLGVKHHDQSLQELGTTQYKVTEPRDMVNVDFRTKQITYKVFKFKVDKQVFLIVLTVKDQAMPGAKKKVPTLNVAFGRQDKNGWDVDDIDTNLTGDNQNQFQIYSTVIKAVQKFINQLNPNVGQIIIKGDNERQQVMYDRFFSSRYLEKFFPGWHLHPTSKSLVRAQVSENFADGRNPQDKGDSKRHGVPTKASVSTLRKVAKQGGRKGQLAHWMANMKAGRAKKND